jgi:hypothetical protein
LAFLGETLKKHDHIKEPKHITIPFYAQKTITTSSSLCNHVQIHSRNKRQALQNQNCNYDLGDISLHMPHNTLSHPPIRNLGNGTIFV